MVKLIAGLGNPGKKYSSTRHNLGFLAIDRLLEESPPLIERYEHRSLLYETEKFGLLCKPLTYMNNSGRAIAGWAAQLNLKPQEILVLYDDFALNLGMIRIRAHGTSGGHNGLESVINSLQSKEVPRVRMGIRTDEMVTERWLDFVLHDFYNSEKSDIVEMLDLCCDAVSVILEDGVTAAMNRFNKKQKLVDH